MPDAHPSEIPDINNNPEYTSYVGENDDEVEGWVYTVYGMYGYKNEYYIIGKNGIIVQKNEHGYLKKIGTTYDYFRASLDIPWVSYINIC